MTESKKNCCPNCGSEKMKLHESRADGSRVLICEQCGESVTMDRDGRRLLMEVPSPKKNGELLLG